MVQRLDSSPFILRRFHSSSIIYLSSHIRKLELRRVLCAYLRVTNTHFYCVATREKYRSTPQINLNTNLWWGRLLTESCLLLSETLTLRRQFYSTGFPNVDTYQIFRGRRGGGGKVRPMAVRITRNLIIVYIFFLLISSNPVSQLLAFINNLIVHTVD